MTWIPQRTAPRPYKPEPQSPFRVWLAFARRLDWSEPHQQDSDLLAFSMLQRIMRSLSRDRAS